MKFPVRFWTALGGVLSTGVAWVAIFVLPITPEGQAATIALGNALILTFSVLFAEQQTTPLADPKLVIGTSYKTTTDDGTPVSVKTVTP